MSQDGLTHLAILYVEKYIAKIDLELITDSFAAK